MKFPKLEKTGLCQFLLYAPPLVLMIAALVLPIFLSMYFPDIVGIITLFAGLLLALAYIFGFAGFLMTSDVVFLTIRGWKKDRTVFRTQPAGDDSQKVKDSIIKRCRRYGKNVKPVPTENMPICLVRRRDVSFTAFYSHIERAAVLFSVEHLTADIYKKLIADAEDQIIEIFSSAKQQKGKPEPAKCAVAVILADSVDEEVKTLAREEVKTCEGCIIPCVAVCSDGEYYFDGQDAVPFPGTSVKPQKNFCIPMIGKLVFSGKIPLENEHERPELEGIDINMSLWEYIAKYRADKKKSDAEMVAEEKKMYAELSDGGVKMGEYAVYCKLGEKLAAVAFIPEEEDTKILYVLGVDKWSLPKKKRISFGEMSSVHRLVKNYLSNEGYVCKFAFEEPEY